MSILRNNDGTFKKGFISPLRNGEIRICFCGNTFYISGYRLKDKKRGKFCSIKCGYEMRKGQHKSFGTEFKKGEVSNENNPNWKGDSVGYYALHIWLSRNFGKASKCANGHIAKIYHWANISGEYKRDISDWHELCQSCNLRDGVRINSRFNL